ncbi:unnamed protein product [Camellia sinensis]
MRMSMTAMEAWKKKLEAVEDIFTVIDSGINVTAWYRPNDFFERRDRIAEKLYVRQPIKGGYCGTHDDDGDDSLDMDLNDGDVDWLNEIVSELVKDSALDTEEELGGDYGLACKGKQLPLVQNALLQSPKRKRSTEFENKKDEQCSVPQAIAKCPRQSTEISKISEPAKAKVKEHKSTSLNDVEAYELKMEATKRELQQRYKQIERAKKKIWVVQALKIFKKTFSWTCFNVQMLMVLGLKLGLLMHIPCNHWPCCP